MRLLIKNEKAAQRVSFGAGYPADVHADISADVRGQKLRSSPRNPGKSSISARTSMTRRRGRPVTRGVFKKNFGQKNFGLNFRSLLKWTKCYPKRKYLHELCSRKTVIKRKKPLQSRRTKRGTHKRDIHEKAKFPLF